MNDFLVSYLDAIDERLLEYLDDDDELRLDVVQRLRFYTSALLDGSLSPDHVMEDWPDWFQLAPAFVAAYGTEEAKHLGGGAVLVAAPPLLLPDRPAGDHVVRGSSRSPHYCVWTAKSSRGLRRD